MTHILIAAPFAEKLIDQIRSVSREITAEQIELPVAGWPADLQTEAEIIYTMSDTPPVDLAPNLRWVQSHWSGIDRMRQQPIWESETIITTASGVNVTAIAQHVFAKILYFANRVPEWEAAKVAGGILNDQQAVLRMTELRGKTLGILGYGSVGREIARVAKTFGMDVLATKRNLKKTSENGFRLKGTGDPDGILPLRLYPGGATRSMIAECDFVVISLPLTDETEGFFGSNLLKAMKPTAYLFSVARDEILVEADLASALNKGWIAGAGLDVNSAGPIKEDSPLWRLDKLLMSPHVAEQTASYNARVVDLFSENLRRYLVGEPLINLVNREREY